MSIEWDIEELAYMAMGKTEKETEVAINDDDIDIDDETLKKYDISFDQYCEIVKDLLPFTPKIKSGISGNIFHAFVVEEDGMGRAIVKIESKNK